MTQPTEHELLIMLRNEMQVAASRPEPRITVQWLEKRIARINQVLEKEDSHDTANLH